MNWPVIKAVGLLVGSNIFMTFAWYAHLRDLKAKPWFIAAFISWGIAFFEYMLQVPANRIGSTALTLPQLKIIQEVITHRLRALCALIHETATQMGLSLGWSLPLRGGVLCVSQIKATQLTAR